MSDVAHEEQPVKNDNSYVLSLNDFLRRFGKDLKEADTDLLRRAYVIGEALHRGQTRDEGTPYFNHPIRVAKILFEEIQICETDVLCAALLHDVVEDSRITVCDLRAMFNPQIADAVRLLTKSDGVQISEYVKAIEEESPLVAVPIKLSDRLDNLRGLPLSKKPNKREKYLEETSKYFLPLAKRHNDYLYDQMSRLIDRM